MKYKINIDREATYQEVFNNLRYGGLKLLFENLKTKTFSQVSHCWWASKTECKIEIITVHNDKIVNEYFMTFSSPTLESMMDNKIFVNNYSRWYIGYIKD